MTVEEIREALRRERIRQNLSQRALAKEAQVPQSTISFLESGFIKNPRVTVLQKWAEGLGKQLKLDLE